MATEVNVQMAFPLLFLVLLLGSKEGQIRSHQWKTAPRWRISVLVVHCELQVHVKVSPSAGLDTGFYPTIKAGGGFDCPHGFLHQLHYLSFDGQPHVERLKLKVKLSAANRRICGS
jgi:hypothetical protein